MIKQILIIFSLVVTLVGNPRSVQAQALYTLPDTAIAYTVPIGAEFLSHGANKILSGDYHGAVLDLNQAIKRDPNDAKAYMNRGVVRSLLGDKQGAVGDFNWALRINPDVAEAYYNRGFVHSELQDYEEALADFDQALQLRPEDADACQCRGVVRYLLGDEQGGVTDLRSAKDLYLKQGKLNEYQGLLNQIRKLYVQPNFLPASLFSVNRYHDFAVTSLNVAVKVKDLLPGAEG